MDNSNTLTQRKCVIAARKKPKIKNKDRYSSELIRNSVIFLKSEKIDTSNYIDLPNTLHNLLIKTSHQYDRKRKVKLTDWNRTSYPVKAIFNQLTMAEQERITSKKLIPFVMHLSEPLTDAAQAQKGSEASVIRNNLKKALKSSLERTPSFWFAIEMGKLDPLERLKANATGKPHIQGSILLYEEEINKAKQAFRKANQINMTESYKKSKQYVDFKKIELRFLQKSRDTQSIKYGWLYADMNWGAYCSKELHNVERLFTQETPVSFDKETNKRAKEIYEQLRATCKKPTTDKT